MFEIKWDNNELDWLLEQTWHIKTPFYFLDENRLKDNVRDLKEKTGTDISVCFSVKANPWYAAGAAECADYVEVCSLGEWMLCRKQGILPEKIVAGGIYKSSGELKELVEARPYRISIESMQQLYQVSEHAAASGIEADILLRISSGNQFGMEPDQVIDILGHPDEFPALRLRGIHYYSGTQKKQTDIDKDITLLETVRKKTGSSFEEIEYGPGFAVPLFQRHDPDEYEACLSRMVDWLRELAGCFKVTLECGRLLTADTGVYVTKIVDRKTNNGREYYIVDGGIHHLHYYGQISGQYAPYIYAGNNNGAAGEKEVAICGALCTANDVLARSVSLPEKKLGDRLVFMNTGAYCATEGISLFLSRELPGIVMNRMDELLIMRNHTDTYFMNMKQ